MGPVKYFGAYLFIAMGYISLAAHDGIAFILLLFSFGIVPIVELVVPPSRLSNNPKFNWLYDAILYSLIPLFLLLFAFFLITISQETNDFFLLGKVFAMGILFGIFGINMAHELGHRKSKFDRFWAQVLLCTSQYTHFYIEHNRGHHKKVATPNDPATARKGENLYSFWFRSVREAYISSWQLENSAMEKRSIPRFSWQNDMVKYSVFQVLLIGSITIFLGPKTLLCYLAAALIGILLLESINYVEHYGLLRKKISEAAYERVQDKHSWNSDHIMGRYLLFELTRHSHHHANSLIKYPNLQSRDNSPQLPTGYPGMILLSMIPSLFFKIMDKRIV